MATITVRPAKQKGGFDVGAMLAFAAIYVLWGSTYLAIRIAVQQVPPLFAAGVFFFLAGTLLYAVVRLLGGSRPPGKKGGTLSGGCPPVVLGTFSAGFCGPRQRASRVFSPPPDAP